MGEFIERHFYAGLRWERVFSGILFHPPKTRPPHHPPNNPAYAPRLDEYHKRGLTTFFTRKRIDYPYKGAVEDSFLGVLRLARVDGDETEGVHLENGLASRRSRNLIDLADGADARPIILYCHGNAESVGGARTLRRFSGFAKRRV